MCQHKCLLIAMVMVSREKSQMRADYFMYVPVHVHLVLRVAFPLRMRGIY